jgi:hypothetical protein
VAGSPDPATRVPGAALPGAARKPARPSSSVECRERGLARRGREGAAPAPAIGWRVFGAARSRSVPRPGGFLGGWVPDANARAACSRCQERGPSL